MYRGFIGAMQCRGLDNFQHGGPRFPVYSWYRVSWVFALILVAVSLNLVQEVTGMYWGKSSRVIGSWYKTVKSCWNLGLYMHRL